MNAFTQKVIIELLFKFHRKKFKYLGCTDCSLGPEQLRHSEPDWLVVNSGGRAETSIPPTVKLKMSSIKFSSIIEAL